ncbi:DUF6602 domain-containing protein [Acidovorax sp.]|jgi:hypothetical protein|uniref:DUF6602 domain-containing protein n=1 Tax=Acidovorax sp. TaxID=1872122 RepID=UPI00391F7B68
MNMEKYFRSISKELGALKDRVRHMIEGEHWPTDGEWKESVLRSTIRRSAPSAVSVGRGFVVTRVGASTQIDVLIYDNAHPVLYRDGDLVFVAPSACVAAIEVKSRLTSGQFGEACERLAEVAEFIRGQGGSRAFIGLFSYESQGVNTDRALHKLAAVARRQPHRVIDHIALGSEQFFKWWPTTPQQHDLQAWRAYSLPQMAAGYFLHNLLLHLGPTAVNSDDGAWFPEQSKEARRVGERLLADTQPITFGPEISC